MIGTSTLRMNAFVPCSYANGPGARAVIWLQGCSLNCPGCYNPQTHAFEGGELVSIDELHNRISTVAGGLEGVTISGGEPMQQIDAVCGLLSCIKATTNLSTLMFSGFSWAEIQEMPQAAGVLQNLDVLIAGRFEEHRRIADGLIGSANKTVHFLTGRYSKQDLEKVPIAEVMIRADGTAVVTGIDPLVMPPGTTSKME